MRHYNIPYFNILKRTLIILILSLTSAAYAQNRPMPADEVPVIKRKAPTPDLQNTIINIIERQVNKDSIYATPVNHAYTFSIAIAFDSLSKIANLTFSQNINAHLVAILGPTEQLKARIIQEFNRRNISIDRKYNNKLVIWPILLMHNDDEKILNLWEFIQGYNSMVPVLSTADDSKQKVLLKPFNWILFAAQQ